MPYTKQLEKCCSWLHNITVIRGKRSLVTLELLQRITNRNVAARVASAIAMLLYSSSFYTYAERSTNIRDDISSVAIELTVYQFNTCLKLRSQTLKR